MTAFTDWQASRQEITPAQLETLFPGTLENFGFDEAPPARVYLYRGDVWITQNCDGSGPYFWLFLEREEYSSTDLEVLEMRAYLWFLDEGCEL